ncbi:MAG: hypothetical protein RL514_1626 [Verrucomicrobiota bacterium]|jgi:hypothetical protein
MTQSQTHSSFPVTRQEFACLAQGITITGQMLQAHIAAGTEVGEQNARVRQDSLHNPAEQRLLYLQYQALARQGVPLPSFAEAGFRVYSQSDEDGLLLLLFSQIGFTNRRCVEMAFGTPYGANVTNLILNWGFMGLMVECKAVEESQRFFATHRDTWVYPPPVVKSWITPENVNFLCQSHGYTGSLDFFSLDMDSTDYWVWERLDAIQPRVVVVEFNPALGAERSLTIPNIAGSRERHTAYYGASLTALVKLGRRKGYRYVGANRYGYNAFFVREDSAPATLPAASLEDAFQHHRAQELVAKQGPELAAFEWVEV